MDKALKLYKRSVRFQAINLGVLFLAGILLGVESFSPLFFDGEWIAPSMYVWALMVTHGILCLIFFDLSGKVPKEEDVIKKRLRQAFFGTGVILLFCGLMFFKVVPNEWSVPRSLSLSPNQQLYLLVAIGYMATFLTQLFVARWLFMADEEIQLEALGLK